MKTPAEDDNLPGFSDAQEIPPPFCDEDDDDTDEEAPVLSVFMRGENGLDTDTQREICVYRDGQQRIGFTGNSKKAAEALTGATIEAWEPGYNMKIRFTDGRKLVIVADGRVGFYIVNWKE